MSIHRNKTIYMYEHQWTEKIQRIIKFLKYENSVCFFPFKSNIPLLTTKKNHGHIEELSHLFKGTKFEFLQKYQKLWLAKIFSKRFFLIALVVILASPAVQSIGLGWTERRLKFVLTSRMAQTCSLVLTRQRSYPLNCASRKKDGHASYLNSSEQFRRFLFKTD